jgi:Concanavalin A-like lectin/glucanases superfamily
MRFIISLLIFITGTAFAQQNSTLEVLQQTYQTKLAALPIQYGKGIDVTLEALKKKGDLDNFLIVSAEKKRFEQEMTIPVPSATHESFRTISLNHYRAIASLQDQYIKALENAIKKEVVAGRTEEAKKIKAEKETISTSLADLKKENPLLVEANTEQPQTAEAPSEKTSTKINTKDLVLHYPFDGLWKTTISDKSGEGADGVLQGGLKTSRGTLSHACLFNGKNDYLVSKANIEIRGSMPWTMSVWFKANNQISPFDNIVSLGKSFVHRGIFGLGAGNDLRTLNVNLWGPDNYTIPIGVDCSTTFIHAVVVYDGGKASIYINGELKDERKIPLSLVQSPVWIGGRTGGYTGQYFEGAIGDVMIFKRALTLPDIQTLYKAQQ